jgi:hypothetical protein
VIDYFAIAYNISKDFYDLKPSIVVKIMVIINLLLLPYPLVKNWAKIVPLCVTPVTDSLQLTPGVLNLVCFFDNLNFLSYV